MSKTSLVPAKPSEATELLKMAIAKKRNVLLTGAPGIGKTSIIHAAALSLQADEILSHPAVGDPTDAKGLPWIAPGADHAAFMPFGDLHRAINASKPTVWFLDDFGQASPSVQAAYMQLLLERRVNDHKISDHVTFVAATNRRQDRANVSGILDPVKSRFPYIIELEVTLADWCLWAYQNHISPQIIAFLNFRPDLLMSEDKTLDISNSPSPRTWSFVNETLQEDLSDSLRYLAIQGSVGQSVASEFTAFLKIWENMTPIEEILAKPLEAKIPTEASALYATSIALSCRADDANSENMFSFLKRMLDAGKQEHVALLMRDATRRNPDLLNTAPWIKACTGEFGKLITGA